MRSGRLESFVRNVRDDLFPDDHTTTTTSMEAPHQHSGCHDAVVEMVSQWPKTGIIRFTGRVLCIRDRHPTNSIHSAECQ
jgi:hypothetical protein